MRYLCITVLYVFDLFAICYLQYFSKCAQQTAK